MKSKSDITLVNVLESTDTEIKNRVKEFWMKHKVLLKDEVLNRRVEQLVFVAYNKENDIIATSTALKSKVKLFNNNWLYQYRCFIDPNFRVIGFDYHLTKQSLEALEAAAMLDDEKPIGVFVVLENKSLYNNKINNAAVWRAYKMFFVGYNTKGQPIRVYYFKGARI